MSGKPTRAKREKSLSNSQLLDLPAAGSERKAHAGIVASVWLVLSLVSCAANWNVQSELWSQRVGQHL
jgi:hypothetical protein